MTIRERRSRVDMKAQRDLMKFERVAGGMMLSDPLGLDAIVEKHHGTEAVLDLFQLDLLGVPILDEDGVAVRRQFDEEDREEDHEFEGE